MEDVVGSILIAIVFAILLSPVYAGIDYYTVNRDAKKEGYCVALDRDHKAHMFVKVDCNTLVIVTDKGRK